MMSLVTLQFQSLDVPAFDRDGDLGVCIVDVVAAHSSKEFSLRVTTLPVPELVVLPIHEDGDDASPSRLRE